MKLRTASIPLMLEYAAMSGTEQESYQKAAEILNHQDYLFEIRRYGLASPEPLLNLQARLDAAFPGNVDIDDTEVISTLSFGPSFGYVYENALHLDLFGIEKYCTMEELPAIILHEMHHLQVQKMIH